MSHLVRYLTLLSLQCSSAYLMSIVLVVNEKWRERVPLWDAFQQNSDSFPEFFHCLLEACLSPVDVRPCFDRNDVIITSYFSGWEAKYAREVNDCHLSGSCLQQFGKVNKTWKRGFPCFIPPHTHRKLTWFENRPSVWCRCRSGSTWCHHVEKMSSLPSQNSGNIGT